MIVYDAGALIAADRSDRRAWADHKALLEAGLDLLTTAPVLAQVSRAGSRQVQLRRFLRGCEVVGFEPSDAHEVGDLLHRARMVDIVDAHLVLTAAKMRASEIRTSDPEDLGTLAAHVRPRTRIERL